MTVISLIVILFIILGFFPLRALFPNLILPSFIFFFLLGFASFFFIAQASTSGF